MIFCKQDPIKDFELPIKTLANWFDTIVVTKKREDIVDLIKFLVMEYNRIIDFPEIQLPTKNGKLIASPDSTEDHGFSEEIATEDIEVFMKQNMIFISRCGFVFATCVQPSFHVLKSLFFSL